MHSTRTTINKIAEITALFQVVKIIATTLGATVGHVLTKEHAWGGLELGTLETSAVAISALGACGVPVQPVRAAPRGALVPGLSGPGEG